MTYKIDLHTHSYGSPDGGLSTNDYLKALKSGMLDYAAITDHGTIQPALDIQKELGILGDRIIIGQEIQTQDGELIGLYLTKPIKDGQTPAAAVKAIRQQGGLVYVPHPFERVRTGMSASALATITDGVDIIEVHNGRALTSRRGKQALAWAEARRPKPGRAASSDAHGRRGWGRDYSVVAARPTKANLVHLLKTAEYQTGGVRAGIIYPKLNRLRRKVRRAHY